MTTPEPDYGAECVKAYGEYTKHFGDFPTCPPGDLTPYIDWSATTPAEPTAEHWMKPKVIDDPSIKPGDIVTFGLDGIKHGRPSDYGYVEVVGPRPAWRRFVDCLMWWKR